VKDIHWPGTEIVRSTNNGFTRGFTDEPVNWSPLDHETKQRISATARIKKARAAGTDRSTLHGLSRKSDEMTMQHKARTHKQMDAA
jgi:hypothetical protein